MKLNPSKEHAGQRLDHFLQQACPDYSRSRLQDWIKAGRVLVNGRTERASRLLREGDAIEVDPAPLEPLSATAEDIPLDVLYEDDDVVAIDKPSGMVVHAGAGIRSHCYTALDRSRPRLEICARVLCIAWIVIPAACCWSPRPTPPIAAWLHNSPDAASARFI